MHTLGDLDKARKKLEDAEALFKKFEDLEIPTSLKKAVEDGWELKQDFVDVGMKLAYDAEEKSVDKKRVIQCRKVLQVLQDLEEELVDGAVVQPVEGIWMKIKFVEKVAELVIQNGKTILDALWSLIKALLSAIWNAIKQLFFDPDGAVQSVINAFNVAWTVLVSCGVLMSLSVLQELVKSMGTPSYVRTVRTALRSRNKAVAALRKKALPQSSGTRYFRRKETVR